MLGNELVRERLRARGLTLFLLELVCPLAEARAVSAGHIRAGALRRCPTSD
jgi:hypothetical protein